MPTTWKQDDVFPIIAQIITDLYAKEQRFIAHDEITDALLRNKEAIGIIELAQKQQDEKQSTEWVAHNMVAWFSERITVGQSDWDGLFARTKIDGKWAYKPKESNDETKNAT
jgi:hypothetical protein